MRNEERRMLAESKLLKECEDEMHISEKLIRRLNSLKIGNKFFIHNSKSSPKKSRFIFNKYLKYILIQIGVRVTDYI